MKADRVALCRYIRYRICRLEDWSKVLPALTHHMGGWCRSGVSRMSAYHHFGMVSPFRVARDAQKGGNTGAKKFADEFLTWRELAYCFCYHNSDILERLQVCSLLTYKILSV